MVTFTSPQGDITNTSTGSISTGATNHGEPIEIDISPNETGAAPPDIDAEAVISRTDAEAESARTPDNTNLQYTDKFKLVFKKIPTTEFFCSSANIPGLGIKVLQQATPYNNINLGGNKVEYEHFTIKFRLDEDLINFGEIKDWIEGIGAPKNGQQFANLINSDRLGTKGHYNIYSDATLLTLTNKYNYNVKIVFRDCFPINLGAIDLDNEANINTSISATFVYKYYDIIRDGGF